MTHRSTTLAQHREKDRKRQRARRQRLRAIGMPMPHQVDNAISEAVSFAIATALIDKSGVRAQAKAQTIGVAMVYNTALDILTKRWKFHPEQAAIALNGRLAKRPEFLNPYWVPHHPACETTAPDMSGRSNGGAETNSGGHVQERAA